jgi:hypothetical protein
VSKDTKALFEELQRRHREAQARLAEATQTFQSAQQAHAAASANLQRAQQAFQTAQAQFHGWNTAVSTVGAEIAAQQEAARAAQPELPMPSALPAVQPVQTPDPIEVPEPLNKTDLIRELLTHHPQGMTPTEIWNQVSAKFKYRAYLYSVLKRLTDRDELSVRRGKYTVRIVPQTAQTAKEETATIQ